MDDNINGVGDSIEMSPEDAAAVRASDDVAAAAGGGEGEGEPRKPLRLDYSVLRLPSS